MEWHGDLPQEIKEQIINTIPTIDDDHFNQAIDFNLAFRLTDMITDRNLNGAIECLVDARKRYSKIQYSLYEAYICIIWNREYTLPTCEENAISTSEYYFCYATLLMYSAAEDLSSFIINFLDISSEMKLFFESEEGKKELEKANIFSNAAKVGIFLRKKYKGNSITNIVKKLHENKSWQKAIEFRNKWVHDKPIGFIGNELEFTREKITTKDQNGNLTYYLSIAKQKYTIDEFGEICVEAANCLATTLVKLADNVAHEKEERKKFIIQPNKETK